MLRQGRVTAGRTVIKETMSPNELKTLDLKDVAKNLILYSQFSSHTLLKFKVSQLYVILSYHIYFLLNEGTYDLSEQFLKKVKGLRNICIPVAEH